ncbi:MAG: thiamine diphosphokinase [Bacteroidales bacterium]|nr:thiamine diphosphokinase [Bacteroidales bacterium]
MSTAVVIGGGDFPRKPYPRELIRRADVIVCCDGSAFKAFLRNRKSIFKEEDRLPDAIIGDLDSLSPSLAEEYSELIVRIEEQDDNDQTKAYNYILKHFPEVDTVHFIAATGKREDHTIGNLGLLMEYARQSSPLTIDMVSDYSTAFVVTDTCELVLGKGRRISLFSPDNSLTLKSKGLVWPTDEVVFDNWWPATLNKASEDVVQLIFSHKSLVLVIID